MTAAAAGATPRTRLLRFVLLATVVLFSAFVQFTVAKRTELYDPIKSDAVKYVAYAWNLKYHHTFSHAPFWVTPEPTHPLPDKLALPGYPAFVSLFLDGSIDPQFLARVVDVQALFGVLTCLMTLLLAMRVLPFGLAVGAGLLVALSPHLANVNTDLLTESLFAMLLTASLLFAVRAASGGARLWNAGFAGAVVGMASLVRPQMQLFPWVLLALCLLIPAWRQHARKAGVGLACFLALTVPWNLRNATVAQAPGDPDLLVMTLYHGAFPGLMYDNQPQTAGYPYHYDAQSAQHSRDVPSALEFIADGFRAHPVRYLSWYLVGKPFAFLAWTDPANATDVDIYPAKTTPFLDQPMFRAIKAGMRWLHWPLMVLALLVLPVAVARPGLLAADPRMRTALRLLALVFAYALVLHMIGAPFARYSVPFRPLAYVLAMATLHAGWCWWASRRPLA